MLPYLSDFLALQTQQICVRVVDNVGLGILNLKMSNQITKETVSLIKRG